MVVKPRVSTLVSTTVDTGRGVHLDEHKFDPNPMTAFAVPITTRSPRDQNQPHVDNRGYRIQQVTTYNKRC